MIRMTPYVACFAVLLLGGCGCGSDDDGGGEGSGTGGGATDPEGSVCPDSGQAARADKDCATIMAELEQTVGAGSTTPQAFTQGTWAGLPAALRVMPPGAELCGARGPARADGSLNTDSGTTVTVTVRSEYCGEPLVGFYDEALKSKGCSGVEQSSTAGATVASWDCESVGTGGSLATVPTAQAFDFGFQIP